MNWLAFEASCFDMTSVHALIRLILLTVMGYLLASCGGGMMGGVHAERDTGGESYLVVESNTGVVLASSQARSSRPIGELTQVATAVVVFDWSTATNSNLSALATVPNEVVSLGGANPMGLQPGDQIQLRDALYSMLLGADAASAQTVANHVGTELGRVRGAFSNPAGEFVTELNRLAMAVGMTGTRFTSAHGLDGTRSTAEDMARLGIYAMRHPGLAFYVKQKSRQIGYFRAGQRLAFNLRNTNSLVGVEDINGLKAADGPISGPCLIASSEKKPLVEKLAGGQARVTPRRLIVVVLRSTQREGRVMGLRNAGWAQYDQYLATGGAASGQPVQVLSVPNPQ